MAEQKVSKKKRVKCLLEERKKKKLKVRRANKKKRKIDKHEILFTL